LDVPGDYSSGPDALDERLRYSLLVMSESGVPISPSESKSVLGYSWKHKVGRLDQHLLAEALEVFSAPKAPLLCFGVAAKPLSAPARDAIVSTLARDEFCQPLLWCGFLLPSGATLPSLEVGGSPLFSVQSVLE
jgi:hypothetical protein